MKKPFLKGLLLGVLGAVALTATAQVMEVHQGTHVFDIVKLGRTGTSISDSYAATLTTNFQGVTANDCKDSAAITVTGAAANDTCEVGPNATAAALDLIFTCYVSAANAVKIHVCNQTGSDIVGMASGAYAVRVTDP